METREDAQSFSGLKARNSKAQGGTLGKVVKNGEKMSENGKKLSVKCESREPAKCAHDISLLVDLLAGEITEETKPLLAAQLDSCEICRNKLQELSGVWSLTREVLDENIHPENATVLDNAEKSDQDNNKIDAKNNSIKELKSVKTGDKTSKIPKKIKFAWLEIAASVIFLLFVASALLPSLSMSRESSRRIACSNNDIAAKEVMISFKELEKVPPPPPAEESEDSDDDFLSDDLNGDSMVTESTSIDSNIGEVESEKDVAADEPSDKVIAQGASENRNKLMERKRKKYTQVLSKKRFKLKQRKKVSGTKWKWGEAIAENKSAAEPVDVEMPVIEATNSALVMPLKGKSEKKRMKRYGGIRFVDGQVKGYEKKKYSRKSQVMKENAKNDFTGSLTVGAREEKKFKAAPMGSKESVSSEAQSMRGKGRGILLYRTEGKRLRKVRATQLPLSLMTFHVSAKLYRMMGGSDQEVATYLKQFGVNNLNRERVRYDAKSATLTLRGLSPNNARRLKGVLKVLEADLERRKKLNEGLPFIKTKLKPFSTFSIDVDTASYTRSAKIIRAGSRPSPASVRPEEFINYFDYHYRSPMRRNIFGVDLEAAPSLFRPRNVLFRIGVLAKRLAAAESKRPSAFTVLIDTSGSMASKNRLELVKFSIPLLLSQMKPYDRISIVACGSSVRLIVAPTMVRNSRRIMAAVAKLAPAGVTDLEHGLRYAYAVAEKHYLAGASNRLVLFTDGVSNISGATAEEILAKVDKARKMGVANTIVSVGGDGDDAFLEALADKGDGNYVFIQHEDDATELFEEQFSARFREVARDVKIQVEFNPALVSEYRQVGYANRQLSKADFRNDKVDAGEVGAGQSVTALYELKLRPHPIPMKGGVGNDIVAYALPLATVRIRYRRSDTMLVEEKSFPLIPANIAKNHKSTTPAFRLAQIAAEFAETLKYANVAGIANTGTIRKKLRPILAGIYARDSKVRNLDTLLRLCK